MGQERPLVAVGGRGLNSFPPPLRTPPGGHPSQPPRYHRPLPWQRTSSGRWALWAEWTSMVWEGGGAWAGGERGLEATGH